MPSTTISAVGRKPIRHLDFDGDENGFHKVRGYYLLHVDDDGYWLNHVSPTDNEGIGQTILSIENEIAQRKAEALDDDGA